jgi:multidrug efflux pump subunit AcrB
VSRTIGILIVLVILGGLVRYVVHSQRPEAEHLDRPADPPASVVVATSDRRDVTVELKGIGVVQAYNTVTFKSRISGPFDQRRTTVDSIIQRLRSKAAAVRGMSLAMQAVQDVQIGGRLTQLLYQYTLEDPNLIELYQWGPRLERELARLPQLRDVQSDLQATAPHASIVIDRDTASRFGITPQAIDDTRS